MPRRSLLLICTAAALSHAYVQFPGASPLDQNPWQEATPRNLEIQIPEATPTPSSPSISTIPTMTTIPIPPQTSDPLIPYHEQLLRWIKRQGGAPVANPAAPQPAGFTQVSPVTVLSMYDRAGKPIAVPYTQTFAAVPDQWPSPSTGTVGLGTIQGEVGVVKTKTKRDLDGLQQDALLTVQTQVPNPARAWAEAVPTDTTNEENAEDVQILPSRRRQHIRRSP